MSNSHHPSPARGDSRTERSSSGLLSTPLLLEHETALFILVSALDLFMTVMLIQRPGFSESNPVARLFLARWGLRGFIAYKFGLVTFICLVTQVIGRRRTVAARVLLDGAVVVTAGAVIYGLVLLVRHLGG